MDRPWCCLENGQISRFSVIILTVFLWYRCGNTISAVSVNWHLSALSNKIIRDFSSKLLGVLFLNSATHTGIYLLSSICWSKLSDQNQHFYKLLGVFILSQFAFFHSHHLFCKCKPNNSGLSHCTASSQGQTKVKRAGQCCDECAAAKGSCLYEGAVRYHGDMWNSTGCEFCTCNRGQVLCQKAECGRVECPQVSLKEPDPLKI